MTAIPRAFVMGHPIAHSRSPMLHGYWLKHYGIAGTYQALDVTPEDLASFFGRFRDEGWAGGNVTVPHKEAVMAFLERIDPAAAAMGAVNTIYRDGDVLAGDNTDCIGFMNNLDDRAPGWGKGARKAVMIGAGGAARAAVYGLLGRGLHVTIVNRTHDKAKALAKHFGGSTEARPYDELPELMKDTDLLVNTTSLGMIHQPPLDLDLAPLKAGATVCDIVYVPLETRLLREAKAKGHPTVDGLGMLLHQAVIGFWRWFGRKPEVTEELRALIEADIRAKTSGA